MAAVGIERMEKKGDTEKIFDLEEKFLSQEGVVSIGIKKI